MNRQQYRERSRQLTNLVNNRRAQRNLEPLREKVIMHAVRKVLGPEPAHDYDYARPCRSRGRRLEVIEPEPRPHFVIPNWPKVWAEKCAHRWQRVPGIGYIPA